VEPNERRLSLGEAAAALGISEITARRWIKSGKLRALQPGRIYQIPQSAVEELLSGPKAPEPLTLAWARAADDGEFYRVLVETPDEEGLSTLLGELSGFVHRGVRRVLTERNGGVFTEEGPEPGPGEYAPMKERLEALKAEVKRRSPPFARMRLAQDGNKCFWFIPREEWENHRERVDEFFAGRPYEDVDARADATLREEDAALA
jgi:excisionase family DNA binding protein